MQFSRFTGMNFLLFFFMANVSLSQNIVINEFMSDNEDSILDEDGDQSDWIEIYNPSSNTINLYGHHLSDDKDEPQKWTFPNINIASNEFLIIYASGKDKHNDQFIHTNFKISDDGEKLILSNALEIKIDEFEKVELLKNQSFGRLPDGGPNKVLLPSASPGTSNNSLNTLIFSHEGGFYNSSIDLSIISPLGDSIFYTTDGSEPSPLSILYTSELQLNNKSSTPNVWSEIRTTPTQDLISNPAWQSPNGLIDKANVIRCASFKNGIQSSKIFSKTYLVDSEIFEKYDMPVVSLITDGDNFFDHDNGIYVPGASYDPASPEWTGNYFTDEVESERPIHIEFYEKDGILGFSQNAGVRIHGGKTRHASQKSLKFYARNDYGEKYFKYPLMPQNGVDEYKRFVLQTTMAAWGGETVIKDVLAHEIVKDMNLERMDYQPAVVFLNGEYWGIHHIRDRIDEEYLSYTSGLDLDSVEIDRIGNSHYIDLVEYFEAQVPLDNDEYNYISTQMDIEGFIDYQIAEMFLNNYDWPANNSRHWRPKKPDGKWRWIFYDIDGGFEDYEYNMFVHNTNTDSSISWPNSPKFTFFFRSLIENDLFLDKFLSRYKELIESDFRFSNTKDKLNHLISQYEDEMPKHIERWNFPASMDSWRFDINNDLNDFLEHRPCAVVEQIISFFELNEYDTNCLDTTNVENIPNEMRQLSVVPNPNNGNFSILNSSQNTQYFDLFLYNTIGELIYKETKIVLDESERFQLPLLSYPSGLHIIKVQDKDTNYALPFVIFQN